MDRRNALKRASLLLGYSLTAPAITGILSGCKPEVVPNFEPKFFAKEQLGLVRTFMDTIIPKTDTPSASEVGVLEFLDELFNKAMKPGEQLLFQNGLTKLAELAGDTPFEKQSEEERSQVLTKMELAAAATEGPKKEQFWYMAKGLIVNGYMLSEEIGTNHLAYDPIPGEYVACADLSISEGKNWSLR